MVITRTPFRVSFTGGGSDMGSYYRARSYGAVVSAAIRHYMYIVIHPYFHNHIRIKYSRTEDVSSVDEIQHPIVREALRRVHIDTGIEIASFSDIPAGTGLGSSSAFTVGLLHALYAFKDIPVSKEQLAAEACEIEIDILQEPIGKQDQFACSYGGLNHIRFNQDESVIVTPIVLSSTQISLVEDQLLLYYVGGKRQAGDILAQQWDNMLTPEIFAKVDGLVHLADTLGEFLRQGEVDKLGHILLQGWHYKKRLASGIATPQVDALLDKAMSLGARGGKLLGAGGSGFLLLFSENHHEIVPELGCRTLPFRIDWQGSQVIARDL